LRYKDKKTFFIQYFFPVCIENMFFCDNHNYFEMSLQYFEEKISFYHNIFLSFYHNIAISRAKMFIVQRPLERFDIKSFWNVFKLYRGKKRHFGGRKKKFDLNHEFHWPSSIFFFLLHISFWENLFLREISPEKNKWGKTLYRFKLESQCLFWPNIRNQSFKMNSILKRLN